MILLIILILILLIIPPLISGYQGSFSQGIGYRKANLNKHFFLIGINSDRFYCNKKSYIHEISIGFFFFEILFEFEKIDYFGNDKKADKECKECTDTKNTTI
jgi:hypothetical protein